MKFEWNFCRNTSEAKERRLKINGQNVQSLPTHYETERVDLKQNVETSETDKVTER